MNITASATGASLLVQVDVYNSFVEDIYLRHLLFDWYGLSNDSSMNRRENKDAPPTTGLAYLCLKGDTARLLQGEGPPPPRGISPVVPRQPYATRLAPGKHFSGEVQLPLPLLEWSAYQSPQTRNTSRVLVRRIQLALEYIKHSNAIDPDAHPTFRGVWRVVGRPVHQFEATAMLEHPVLLLERTDGFKRF